MNPKDYLTAKYDEAMIAVGSGSTISSRLPYDVREVFDEILQKSESAKGVLAVILTSLVHKIMNPTQDVRKHQTSIQGGYSGRTFDSKYVTPFLKEAKFPAMAESGWLTRSLEQKVPYDENYSGAINPASLKKAFLDAIAYVEKNDRLEEMLSYFLQSLIIQRNSQTVDLAKPVNLPIAQIINLLTRHFNHKYVADGASRLPVLALYAAYKCFIEEFQRFEGKRLLAIESHTSADMRSGRIGDIEIVDENGRPFEAVEVKHGIPLTKQMVVDAFQKFSTTQVSRYYLLSTANIDKNEEKAIAQEIERIKNIHGCHVIANGLVNSLKYYLRTITNTSHFIEHYVNLTEVDTALKFEHKKQWNIIVGGLE